MPGVFVAKVPDHVEPRPRVAQKVVRDQQGGMKVTSDADGLIDVARRADFTAFIGEHPRQNFQGVDFIVDHEHSFHCFSPSRQEAIQVARYRSVRLE
jgi:hypothetical protein